MIILKEVIIYIRYVLYYMLHIYRAILSEINHCVQVTQRGVCCKWSKPYFYHIFINFKKT